MALDPERLMQVRPFLFHLTARENIEGIKSEQKMFPAKALLESAGRQDLIGVHRRAHRTIYVKSRAVKIRDQDKLHAANIEFESGWDLTRFIGHVDSHVFFWPGTPLGPIKNGQEHFGRYAHERPVLIRVGFRALVNANESATLLLCRFNSGAPRTIPPLGRRSPRGSTTYVPAEEFDGTAKDVKEVVFRDNLILPQTETAAADSYEGPWRKLWS
jgi:hypothetical protein